MQGISKYSREQLSELIKDGLVSSCFMTYKEIVEFVNNETSMGVNKTQAVANAAQQYGYSESAVWQILRGHG